MDAGAFLHERGDAPALHAVLRPHRSLPPEGFAWVIGIAAVLLGIPLLPLLGTPALWALLPFLAGAVWLLWAFLRRNYRDAQLTEELWLWADRIEIRRTEPDGRERAWAANPFWVSLSLRPEGGPVEAYLTLAGAGREVELGAFLAPEERQDLHAALAEALAGLKGGGA